MRLLVIAPLHDYPTSLSTRAVFRLTRFMDSRDINYDLLWGLSANRPAINHFARTHTYNGVFYYGHGMEDRLGGALMPIIGLIDAKNIGLFEDTIFYTMACLSGRELSKEAIKKGVSSYYGQTVRYFAFVSKMGLRYDFMDDWIRMVNLIPKRLILGDSTGIALHKYEHYANKLYTRYLELDKDTNLHLVYKNALHLELYGKRDAIL